MDTRTDFLSLTTEAQLHRDVYIAALEGVLRPAPAKQELAWQLGVKPRYLSYLLEPDDARVLGPELAGRIVDILPLPRERRQDLLDHMLFASERRLAAARALGYELTYRPPSDLVVELRRMRDAATYAPDPAHAKPLYLAVRDASATALHVLDARRHPLAFVELCLLMYDVQCVLHRPEDALYHGKLARTAMDQIQQNGRHSGSDRLAELSINVIRAEAVAFHNLGLSREAYDTSVEAEAAANGLNHPPGLWLPQLYRDKLKALSGRPRFTRAEAEGLARRIREIAEEMTGDWGGLVELLAQEALGRAYLRRGDLRRAETVLGGQLERLDRLPHAGPLDRTALLKTWARLRWEQGDREEWKYWIRRTLVVALQAGLQDQVGKLQRLYGGEIEPVLVELERQLPIAEQLPHHPPCEPLQ